MNKKTLNYKKNTEYTNKKNFADKLNAFISDHKNLSLFLSGIIFATPFIQEWLFPFTFLGLILFFYIINKDEKQEGFKRDEKHEGFKRDEKAEIDEKQKHIKAKKFYRLSPFLPFFFFLLGCFLTVYTLFLSLYPLDGYDFTEIQKISFVVFAWLGASVIHSIIGTVILSFSKRFSNSDITYALAFGALWVIFEYSLSLGFLAFPWVNITISLIKFLPFLQTASLFGNGIITLITVFSCCCIALFLRDKRKINLLKISTLVLALNLLVGSVLFVIPEDRDKKVTACIIQGNITMGEKWQSGNFTQVLESHNKLIRKALDKGEYDIVLMAETVFPAIYTEGGMIRQTLSAIAIDYNITVIFGVLLKEESGGKVNATMAIYPNGEVSKPYIKQKLVPFGEKYPEISFFANLLPSLEEINSGLKYVEGTESTTIKSDDETVFGSLICYDSVFSSLSRESVLNGAELLLVSTNDSWYKDGIAVNHHKSQSVVRAIETGRYVFRAANTGISCVITSKGKITTESEVLTECTIDGEGYTSDKKTLFVLLGNTSLYFSFIYVFAIFFHQLIKKQRNS